MSKKNVRREMLYIPASLMIITLVCELILRVGWAAIILYFGASCWLIVNYWKILTFDDEQKWKRHQEECRKIRDGYNF